MMAEIIYLGPRTEKSADNVITLTPLEFREADWGTSRFVQMTKSGSVRLEDHRRDTFKRGKNGPWQLPPHYLLSGGMAHTIMALYTYREDEAQMREVYYLMGLVDCMINQVNPVLRTDLIRDMYKRVFEMKASLGVHWHGHLGQILLPIDTPYFNDTEYRLALTESRTLKELYHTIRSGTDQMFDILSLEYVFYRPSAGSSGY